MSGRPAARLSDRSAYASPISANVSLTAFINDLNAATLGNVGGPGNTGGSDTLSIGSSGDGAPFSRLRR